MADLGLEVGRQVFAIVKSVAIDRSSIGFGAAVLQDLIKDLAGHE